SIALVRFVASTTPVTALPVRSLLPATAAAPSSTEGVFAAQRRLARLATNAAAAAIYLIRDPGEPGGAPTVIREGFGVPEDSRALRLARRVLMAGGAVVV